MPRQLPAGACIRHAMSSVRNNIAYAFRISWPWYAVFVPIVIVLSSLARAMRQAAIPKPIRPLPF